MTERISAILSRLKRIQRRILITRTVLGFSIFFSILLVILLLTALSSRLGHGALLLGILFWTIFLLGLVGLVILVRKSWLNLEQTALVCERKFPQLNDGLISLVQLSRMILENRADFSLTMFEQHLAQMENRLSQLRLEDSAESKQLRLPLALSAFLFVIWLTFIFSLPGFPSAMFQSVALKDLSRVPGKEFLKVSRPLELYDLIIDYQFPAYSGLKSKHIEGSDGSLLALVGSEVQIQAQTSAPIVKAWIQVLPQTRILAEVKDRKLKAKMAILQSGQYRFEGEDKDGRLWSEPEFHKVTAMPDQAPVIELLEPDRDLVVNEEQALTLRFHLRDDYGLESVYLVFSTRGKEKQIPLKEYRSAELEDEQEYQWNILAENFLPGEKVAYYIEAKDNNNVTGPGIGRSQTRYLEIFSPLKAHEELIAKEQELFEKLIAFLAKSLEAGLKKLDSMKYWETESALIAQFKELKDFIGKLAPEVEKDSYSPELIKEMLAQSLTRYQDLIREREGSQRARNQVLTEQLRGMTVSRLEQDILFWDSQLQKQRMDFLLALGDRLKAGQKELKELLERYERTKDPALLKEIEDKLSELKMLYQEFLARMSEMGQTLPDEFVNIDALEKMGAGEVMSKLEKFRQAIHDRDMENALQEAEDFMSALEQMLGELEQGSEKAGSSLSPELMTGLEEGLKRLKALKAEEEKLIQETERIYQKQVSAQEKAGALSERKKNALQAQLDQLLDLIQNQYQEVNQIEPEPSQDWNQKQEFFRNRSQISNQLWRMSRTLESAKNDLEQDQLESATEKLAQIERQMNELKQAFQKISRTSKDRERSQKFESSCNSGIAQAGSAKKTSEALAQEMKAELSEQDQARLSGLGKKQGEVEAQLDALMKELGELFGQLPVQPKNTMEHLGKADVKMKDAQGELGLKNVALGLMAEKEARYWLEQAESSFEQFMDKLKGKARPSGIPLSAGMSGSGRVGQSGQEGRTGFPNLENFKIPGPDENKNPVEMRKKILRAMREESPKEYEDLNRDYYRRLVE